ncbi:MAG: DNA repair protein RecO [Planctomycetota bacterium]|nr:DNA repair protein RecO [Planctomycetota bacterium]
MATIVEPAVCVRQWDWSETSQTVSLFCREFGLLRGLAKGSRREKANFSGGIELLTLGEIVAIPKVSALATLTAWDLINPFTGVRRHLDRFYAGMAMLELTSAGLQEGDPHPALFDSLVEALGLLAGGEADALVTLARYQWALLSETGSQPELELDRRSGKALAPATLYAFIPALGGFQGVDDGRTGPPGSWLVRSETLKGLRAVASGAGGAPDRAVAGRCVRLLASYARELLHAELPALKAVEEAVQGSTHAAIPTARVKPVRERTDHPE